MEKKKTKSKVVSKVKAKAKTKVKVNLKLKPKTKAKAISKTKAKVSLKKSKPKAGVKLQTKNVKKQMIVSGSIGKRMVASEVALGVVIALAVIFAIIFFFTAENISTISDQPLKIELPIKKETKTDEQVVCTMDAKQCSDGTFVGRVAPNCDFAPCPNEK